MEKLFSHNDSEVVKQAALTGCAVSVLGGFQAPAGSGNSVWLQRWYCFGQELEVSLCPNGSEILFLNSNITKAFSAVIITDFTDIRKDTGNITWIFFFLLSLSSLTSVSRTNYFGSFSLESNVFIYILCIHILYNTYNVYVYIYNVFLCIYKLQSSTIDLRL